MKSTCIALAALFIAVKGLGGSFNSVFTAMGWGLFHGPVVGTLFAILLGTFFLTYSSEEKKSVVSISSREKTIFSVVYFLMIAVALWIRWQLIQKNALDINRADMLFAIQAEIDAFLKGINPYGPLTMTNGGIIQHGYPPLLWLGYLPFSLLHLDLRCLNLIAQGVFYFFLWDIFLKQKRFHFSSFAKSAAFFIVLVGFHCFSKQATRQPMDVHMGPYWLCFTLFLWALSRGNFSVAFWILPLLCLCREPAFLWALPLLLLFYLKERTLFWEAFKKLIIGGFAIAGVFILWSPKLFFSGVLFYGAHVYQTPLNEMLRFYGLSGVLAVTGLLVLQKPLQALGILVTFFWVSRRRDTLQVPQALALGGFAYLTLMLFVSLSYPFVYSELIMLVYALLFWPSGTGDKEFQFP